MKILLATDGSEYSEGAARFLARFDLSADDEITVFHAVNWVPFLYDRDSYVEAFRELKREMAPRILDSVVGILNPVKAKISTAIVDGAAEQYIIEASEEGGMDLIVMGARGIKGIRSLIIGSVTKSVALNSTKPVLITKLPARDDPDIRILFATDGSDHSEEAARFVSSMPFHDGTEVTILNVIWSDFSDIPERFVMEVNERMKDVVAGARTVEFRQSEMITSAVRTALEGKFRKLHEMTRVGDPSAEILKAADKLKPDIIVLGCRGLRGMKGMMGSVSRNVITHCRCSALVAKPCRG